MRPFEFELLTSREEYEYIRRQLALAAVRENIIEPGGGHTFKIMKQRHLDYLQRVPVYTNNRLAQSIPTIRSMEVQLLAWRIEQDMSMFDAVAPVPDEANGISFSVAEKLGLPHIQPRRLKGYGVQGKGSIDGVFGPGDRFALIEGTSSTLRSILAVVKRLKIQEMSATKAYPIFTYWWGNESILLAEGCLFQPILTVREVFDINLEEDEMDEDIHAFVTGYLKKAEEFFRGRFTRARAEKIGLLRPGY